MKLDFQKYADGLIPAIVQDADSRKVLMLGFMNEEALEKTRKEGKITFFSRSKKRLWTKGESSGNYLELVDLLPDCDHDTLLITANPSGPVCHTGADTCFGEVNRPGLVERLEKVIDNRFTTPSASSYVSSLAEKGMNKIAQKVGEEAVELVIEAKDDNDSLFLNEAADLLFHYLILLRAKGLSYRDVLAVLEDREG